MDNSQLGFLCLVSYVLLIILYILIAKYWQTDKEKFPIEDLARKGVMVATLGSAAAFWVFGVIKMVLGK